MNSNQCKKEGIYALVTACISIVLVYWLLGLKDVDFHVPFTYSDDGMCLASIVKGMGENGWFFTNPNLGAPFEGTLYDYPFYGDTFWLVIIKILMSIFKSYGMALNIFYIMLFPVTSVITYGVLRKLRIKEWIAVLGSLSYSFLFYHFTRLIPGHILLAAYCFIPISVLICLWTMQDDEYFRFKKGFLKSRKNIFTLVMLPIIASSGIYYAFFMCFFLGIIGLVKWMKQPRNIRELVPIIGIVAIIVMTIGLLMIPNQIYIHNAGVNPEAPQRGVAEAEVYGLKLARLLIPAGQKNIPIISEVQQKYADVPLPGEGSEYLGLFGVLGFLVLMVMIFIENKKETYQYKVLKTLSQLNIAAILLATIGGFSTLFAIFISTKIRGYNRISVYIAFFGIAALCILLNEIDKKLGRKSYIFKVIVVGLTLVGIIEQSWGIRPNYEYNESRYYNDKTFVGYIENTLGEGSSVYQLPYQRFPENPPINNMKDYASFRGYLHSTNLKWSYGAYKGRTADKWNQVVSSLEVDQMLETLALTGFEGIYIDREGYLPEDLEALESQLEDHLGVSRYLCQDESLSFFDMRSYVSNLKQSMTDEQWQEKMELAKNLNGTLE